MRRLTHRCDGQKQNDDYQVSQDFHVPCKAVRYSDGTVEGTCGEPCSWIMGKSGYGVPPWESNAKNERMNPLEPDTELQDFEADNKRLRKHMRRVIAEREIYRSALDDIAHWPEALSGLCKKRAINAIEQAMKLDLP